VLERQKRAFKRARLCVSLSLSLSLRSLSFVALSLAPLSLARSLSALSLLSLSFTDTPLSSLSVCSFSTYASSRTGLETVFRFDPQDNFLPDLCAKIVNSHSYAVLRCVVVVVVWSVWSVFVCVWVGGGGGGGINSLLSSGDSRCWNGRRGTETSQFVNPSLFYLSPSLSRSLSFFHTLSLSLCFSLSLLTCVDCHDTNSGKVITFALLHLSRFPTAPDRPQMHDRLQHCDPTAPKFESNFQASIIVTCGPCAAK
jgi:hypothetical protein